MPSAAAWDFDAVTFEDVTFDYGRRRVLSRISFSCTRGTVTGLLGPNGAGKTTLLGVASTRARPSRGSVRFGDLNGAVAGALVRGRIGWLGHDPGLYPELSARENLLFFASLHDLPEAGARVARALEQAGLAARADDPVGSFSRGMRQRVGLERALLHEPTFVLLDEPFTGLDDASSRALLARLAALRAQGAIVLLSTHDLALVEPVLDAAIVLREGRMAARVAGGAGLPDAVREVLGRDARAASMPAGRRASRTSAVPANPAVTHDSGDAPATVADPVPGSSPASGAAVDPPGAHIIGHAPETGAAPSAIVSEPPFTDVLRSFARVAALVARKDLVVEFRSRELLLTTLFFAATVVLVFAFAFVRDGRPLADAAAGILWVATAFAGTLALGRTFDREQANQTLPALLHAPVDRAAIYTGKLLGLLALLWLVLVPVVPLIALLFQAGLFARPLVLLALLAAGTVGFLAVGSLFASMLVRTRSRDVLLPVLLYPMVVPVMLAGVRGTAALLQATPDLPTARLWLSMLLFFDTVFVTLALWTFDAVTSE
ncbi:MAG TPA: ATP-binding cassette domain-containing protein [Vicinamibacterales bacterium]